MYTWLTQSWRQLVHRGVSFAVLIAVLTVVFPVPWPVFPAPGKDTSEPFPCQNRPCGCRTAAQCRKKCCCFTRNEKVAWAKKHQISVDRVVDDASAPGLLASAEPAGRSCCQKKPTVRAHEKPLCCAKSGECESKGVEKTVAVKKSRAKIPKVIGILAEKCQGQYSTWFSLPWTVLNPPFELPIATRMCLESCILISDSECGLSDRPPTPPPKKAVMVFIAA